MPRRWIDTIIDSDVANSAQVLRTLMTGVTAVETRLASMTLLRTIVGVNIGYSVHDSGEGSQRVALGIGITSQESFAAGTVSDPSNDQEFPVRGWVWRYNCRVFGFAADQPAVFTQRIDVDLRGQRKLENGECFLAADNNAVEGTAATIRVTGLVRQLWLVG